MSTHRTVIKHKVGLLRLAQELGNVSQACKVMGYSRDTFYRYQQAVEEGGVEALLEKSRRKPNLRNRTAPEIEEAIVGLAFEQPAFGQVRVSNELRKRGHHISPAGVRGVWLRHGLLNDRVLPFFEQQQVPLLRVPPTAARSSAAATMSTLISSFWL